MLLVRQGRLARLVSLAAKVLRVSREQQGLQEPQVLLELPELPAGLERRGQLDRQVSQEAKVLKASREQQGLQARLALPVRRDHKALLVLRGRQDKRVSPEQRERRELAALREPLDQLALLARLGQQA